MHYDCIKKGTFVSRPNRFIAHILVEGKEEICHVKNTGRCRELLTPNATVFLQEVHLPHRRTNFDLIGVYKGERLINMDSQVPNKAVGEWLRSGGLYTQPSLVQPEHTFHKSRFDFYLEGDGKKAFLEVKGVTLEVNGAALFPDAPTERGIKHLQELELAVAEGYDAYVFFLVQMENVTHFSPNTQTHAAFAQALIHAQNAGVQILCYDCHVTPDSIAVRNPVPVQLDTTQPTV